MAEKKVARYEDSELYKIRHSAAHVMAQAVTELFAPGEAKIAIGPPIAEGFYYDFELPRQLTPEDFPAIEQRMRDDRQKYFKDEAAQARYRELITAREKIRARG